MQAITVNRVLVWSRWLRLSHWLLALSAMGLLVTGWLMGADPLLAVTARDYHDMLGALLLPALALRLYILFFGKGSERLEDCEPDRHRMRQALGVLKFYLSLGRHPLPKWFSHNPLWGPIYLVLFFFLLIACISGLLLLKGVSFLGPVSNLDLHDLAYYVIGWFVLLHLPAVFSHDLGNQGSDNSGMINGYRTFRIEDPNAPSGMDIKTVSLSDLMKTLK